MVDYFKPWRRKLGVVTLVLACLVAAGWVRSFQVEDYFNAFAGRRSVGLQHYYDLWSAVSADGSLYVGKIWGQSANVKEIDEAESYYRYPQWATVHEVDFPSASDLRYIWQFCGFGVYERYPGDPDEGGWRVVIPYWSLVTPVMLLSGYLLTGKSRSTLKASPGSEHA